MKKLLLFLSALLAGASLPAQTPAPAYSVTMDFPYASKYVFRGVQLADGSFQPSVKLTSGSFYLGLWTNQPITSNIDNEIDVYGGYGFKLNDTWSLDVGATLYYYPELDDSTGLDSSTFEPYVGLNGSFGRFTTGVYVYNDFTIDALTFQGTVGYSVPISDKATFSLLGTIGNVSPDAGGDYTYYGIGATVPYKLTDTATLTVGLQYATHDIDGLDDNHFWGTVGVTVVF